MSIFQDRQNRNCLLFLSFFSVMLLGIMTFAGFMQLRYAASAVLENEQTLFSSLLEQGVSKEVLAAAVSENTVTEEGILFLRQIGHLEPVSVWLLPSVRGKLLGVLAVFMLTALVLAACLLSAALHYMKSREHLYERAADIVERFARGDFSRHLPRNHAGTVYRLFASIDQLSIALQTKGEAEHRAKEFLKDTMSDISHQLKTPLAALQMYTEIICREPENPDTVRRFSEKSMQSLLRMEELIQSLLKIGRLDAGSIHFEKHSYPVTELVEQSLQNLRFRAEQEKKRLVIAGDSEEVVYCDMEWSREALGNLIKNALDHTKEGGSICVSWESSPAMVRLSVTDDGCGIAPEDIHHVFKRFYRSSRSSDRQGAGLGLSLAKGIVEGQGGILSVESSPGNGACFGISFLTES